MALNSHKTAIINSEFFNILVYCECQKKLYTLNKILTVTTQNFYYLRSVPEKIWQYFEIIFILK